jgi:transposase
MILSGGVQISEDGNRRRYDRAFKVEAMRLVTEERRKVTEVAGELGINANQLHRWKRKLAEEGQLAFPGKGRLTPEQEELRRLRRVLTVALQSVKPYHARVTDNMRFCESRIVAFGVRC